MLPGRIGSWARRVAILLAAALVLFSLVVIVAGFCESSDSDLPPNELVLSEVIAAARNGEVAEIEVAGDAMTVRMKGGGEFRAYKEEGTSIVDVLTNQGVQVGGAEGVKVVAEESSDRGGILPIVMSFLPLALFGAILIAFMWADYRRKARKDD